jgi:MtN3 and saliva related transmembrane protein
MNETTWIGLAASICTGISLLPQLLKIIKEKKASDISYPMLIILFCGLGLWIWYGVEKEDWIIIISNSVSLLINITIFFLNQHYPKK